MKHIRCNEDILLSEGYSEYTIDTDRDIEVTFRAEKNADAFIRIEKCGKMRIRTFTPRNAKVNLLFWNEAEEPLEIDESHEVMGNAELRVAYGECNDADTTRNTYVALRESGANATVSSASLVRSRKNYHMDVVNFAPKTFGDIHNYAVVLKGGRLMIDAIGKIVKGASRSESHQTSRALSFEAGQNAEILPELLIDENDVQASHAMSIGTVDEDQLYYMQSRGLTSEQCTALIANGYLLPIADTLDNDDLKKQLHEELERKMAEL